MTKSIRSSLPKQARAKRTGSWMVVSIPVCVNTCANAATSPNQEGIDGCDSGEIWMVTVECIIFLLSHLECKKFSFSLFTLKMNEMSEIPCRILTEAPIPDTDLGV